MTIGIEFQNSKQFKTIFSFHKTIAKRLVSRESTWLEFKESFNWSNKASYSKTMASFSNNKGGYIVFGIQDQPRNIVGLKGSNFETLDENIIGTYLNSTFSPEICFEKFVVNVKEFKIGIIYTHPCDVGPVIAIKNDGRIKESEIYYRYAGSSEKIKYPELIGIINDVRVRERNIWKGIFENVAQIGPTNVAVLDLISGNMKGKGGGLMVDKELISQIKFIKEGSFSEKGSPALKLVGSVEPVSIKEIQGSGKGSVEYKISNDPHAFPVTLSEKSILERYPYGYAELVGVLLERYNDFKRDKRFHRIRKGISDDPKYCRVRLLNPNNPNSSRKDFYSKEIINEFDKFYTKKMVTHKT